MADTAEPSLRYFDVGFKHIADRSTQREVSVADDRRDPGSARDVARGSPIGDKFCLTERAHRLRPVGSIAGAAVDEHGLDHVVSSARVDV
jgi:hypothetical protein